MPKANYTPYAFPGTVDPFPGLYTKERTLFEQTFQVPSLGIFYKVSEKFTVGIGVAGPFGLGAKFDIVKIPPEYENSTPLEEYESTSDHQVVIVQPTIALKLTEKISIGFGVGYIGLLNGINKTATYLKLRQIGVPEYRKVIQAQEAAGQVPPGTYQNYLSMIALLQGQTALPNPDIYDDVKSRLIMDNYLEGDDVAHAWSFGFGIHLKPSESLSFGFSGKIYTDLKLEGTMTRKIHFPGGANTYISQLRPYFPFIAFAGEDTTALKNGLLQTFNGGIQTINYDGKADLPLPMTLGAGVAFKPLPRLTLTADVSYTQWSSWETIEIKLKDPNGAEETLPQKQDWKSTVEFGAGAEFCVFDQDNMKLDLRGGFYMVDSPASDETISPTILDPNKRTVLTAGFGLNLGIIQFSLAYERIIIGDKDVKTWVFEDELGGSNGNWAGLYKTNANVITIGTTIGL